MYKLIYRYVDRPGDLYILSFIASDEYIYNKNADGVTCRLHVIHKTKYIYNGPVLYHMINYSLSKILY